MHFQYSVKNIYENNGCNKGEGKPVERRDFRLMVIIVTNDDKMCTYSQKSYMLLLIMLKTLHDPTHSGYLVEYL